MTGKSYDDGRHIARRHHRVIRPLMREVAADLRAGQSVQLVGGRKLGKTVTAHWLGEALWGDETLPECIVARYSLQAGGRDTRALFSGLCRAIERAARKALKAADLKLDAPPLPEPWPADGRFQVFRRWLEGLIDAIDAEYGALPLVLALDEGERILDFEQPTVVLGQLRALLEAESTVTLLVTGYHALYVYRDADDRLSPLRNVCKTRRMGLLDEARADELMAPLLDGIDDSQRDAMRAWLVDETGGHPYLIQSLCHHIQRRGVCHSDGIGEAIGDAPDHAEKAFKDWVAVWSPETRALFAEALAAGPAGCVAPPAHTAPVQLLCYAGVARLVGDGGASARLVAPVQRFNRWYASTAVQAPGIRRVPPG